MKCEICGADPMTANCNNANCDTGKPDPVTDMTIDLRLDFILKSNAAVNRFADRDAMNEYDKLIPAIKQAILDWHNKQVDEIVGGIDSLELDDYDDTDPYQQGYMWAIGQAKTVVIEAVRNKLKEQSNE